MAASSSSSTSSRISRVLHDVFLSFCDADTRYSFTSHLMAALDRQGFSTFRDSTNLRSGEDFSYELLKTIEESRVSIVVFSKNYAASRWCLDELVKILECRRDFNQIVLPVFYYVSPSHVRAQLESYSEAFEKYEDRVKEGRLSIERVESWRAALTEATNLSGYDLQNGDEATLVNVIVKDTINRLDRLYSGVADNPVGIESHVQQLKKLLNLGAHDVRKVAIWGVDGIGKTTIAKAIFNCIRSKFEGSSFLADVSVTIKESSGVVKLQKQLLSNILRHDIYNLDNYHQGIKEIKQIICHRRVLLVLDGVDDAKHLKKLAINRRFFSPGSRIIIITRNMTSLPSFKVNSVYSPSGLNKDESLMLFSWNAFKTYYPKEDYRHISNEIVAYAQGLPLVLEVLGSSLKGRSTTEWKSVLDKLKASPICNILQTLRISFDSLDVKNQELFLDIAIFFIGRDTDFTVKVLEDSGCFPESGIGELTRRCLVRVDQSDNKLLLRMHDVLRDMGREIVCQQSLKLPGKRSRLWYKKEVLEVLRDFSGTEAIEGLSLELPVLNNEQVHTKAFVNMSNLRLLHLKYLQHVISGTYIPTLRNLKWLCWHGFPLAYIPPTLCTENLVAIDLQHSKLKQIWLGPKRLDKLRFLNLSHSYHLIETPDFSGLKSLEMLSLNDCTSLVKVHNSIGCLDKLRTFNMTGCINLSKIPSGLGLLNSLEKLDISRCSKLEELAECKVRLEYIPISLVSVHGLSCVRELNLAMCNMEYVPGELGSLITLEKLDLSGNKIYSLPSSFSHLSHLRDLRLDHCIQLKSLANLPNNLIVLTANSCISLETASVGTCVMRLEFTNCPKLDVKSVSNFLKRNILQARYELIFPGRELPSGMQFQGIGANKLSFVVPPLVGKKIIGLIACAVVSYSPYFGCFKIVNKTKSNSSWEWWWPKFKIYEDHVWIIYEPIRSKEFTLEGGDEVDVILEYGDADVVKRLGASLIYEDDNKYPDQTSSKLISY